MRTKTRPATLAIDVGGTHLKATLLDAEGRMISDRRKCDTPKPCTPERFLKALRALCRPLGPFARVSVGFPGVVRHGRVVDAPNLSKEGWHGFDIARAVSSALGKPARVMNDADMQGCAVVEGRGVELVVTLGTGVGTSLFDDGRLLPHIELGMAYHPAPKGQCYNEYVGDRALRRVGKRRWNRRVLRMLRVLKDVTHYDLVHIGGGNAAQVSFPLEEDMRLVSNKAGVLGGIILWRHGHDV